MDIDVLFHSIHSAYIPRDRKKERKIDRDMQPSGSRLPSAEVGCRSSTPRSASACGRHQTVSCASFSETTSDKI